MRTKGCRPRSFQSVEQVDMLVPPGDDEIHMSNNPEMLDLLDFKRPWDWGSYLGYEA